MNQGRIDRVAMGERALPKLATRGLAKLHQFHLAETSKGIYCLDFDRYFETLETFEAWAIDLLTKAEVPGVLPAAPASRWREFMDESRFAFVRQYSLPPQVAQARGVRRVVICRGEFSV